MYSGAFGKFVYWQQVSFAFCILFLDFEGKSAFDWQLEQCLVPSPIQICVPSRHRAAATVTVTAAAKNL
jgi:hypothetical protein